MSHPHRIVFMGSPDFAVPALEALAGHYHLVGVVTQPDRPAGRGQDMAAPAVKKTALRLGIPVVQPEKLTLPQALSQLQAWNPDLIVVAAYGQILRPAVLDLPRYGCINVHGSLLPRGRGAAPIQAAILAGEAETGITIMKMDMGVDTGPILSQRALPIAPDDTGGTLFAKMASLGAVLLLETLPTYLAGELVPRPQAEENATYAPMLAKKDGLLDFVSPAAELERRVRAFDPWPGTWFEWNDVIIKVLKVRVSDEISPGIGQRIIINGNPAVGTRHGILILEEIQPAGKKRIPGKAFLTGARAWINT
jgi:methionyl-tRNA formyltransferase